MQKSLKHKGYQGTVEVDFKKGVLFGKVLFINSLITYAGATPAELQRSFTQEVDDYICDCAALGVEPEKPFSGTFQIRCSPSLHKELTAQAFNAGISFNKYVVSVLSAKKKIA
ncbi:MAG: type II toxin-antitoxin system HicB family antitoxin [Gammaproteobacteria bacterium]|jgi:predicted HicB family RNase H-like nuclease|nr:type II toxin-antitoxin system HicB family antitoxin [Gammaproteobacteria bacterium]